MKITKEELTAFVTVLMLQGRNLHAAVFQDVLNDMIQENATEANIGTETEEEQATYWLIKNAPLFLQCKVTGKTPEQLGKKEITCGNQ